MSINIAIDGPAGAGKSTIADRLAEKTGFIHVDTGALYRAMALYMLRQNTDVSDTAAVADACKDINIGIDYQDGLQIVLLNGENVNGQIRTEAVSQMASKISAIPLVRAHLLSLQQDIGKIHNVIMDGRDIGTHVLPEADVKIFLTADPHVRALRRYEELTARGEACDLEAIEKDIIERDYRDSHREAAPLRQAEDAVLVDTSYMDIEEVTAHIYKILGEKGAL